MLRARRGIGLTQLGGDEPPQIQGQENLGYIPLQNSGFGGGNPQRPPFQPIQAGHGINQLQPANAPMSGQLPQLPDYQTAFMRLLPMIAQNSLRPLKHAKTIEARR